MTSEPLPSDVPLKVMSEVLTQTEKTAEVPASSVTVEEEVYFCAVPRPSV